MYIDDTFSSSQRQFVSQFIRKLSKLEDLELQGSVEPDCFPLYAKLPIKKLTFDFQENVCHCPEFVQNCISTLKTVKGWLSVETHRALMKSSKLRKLTWELSDQEITPEEIASFQINHSVQSLIVDDLFSELELKPIGALLRKFDALTCLKVFQCPDASDIRSTKIKTFKIFICYSDERFFNQLKLSLPNVENLMLDNAIIQDDPNEPDILMIVAKQNWILKSLNLEFNELTCISLDSLKYLLQSCPSLKLLTFCGVEFVWNLNSFTSDREFISGYIRNGLLSYDMKINYLSDGSSKYECSPPIPVFCDQVKL